MRLLCTKESEREREIGANFFDSLVISFSEFEAVVVVVVFLFCARLVKTSISINKPSNLSIDKITRYSFCSSGYSNRVTKDATFRNYVTIAATVCQLVKFVASCKAGTSRPEVWKKSFGSEIGFFNFAASFGSGKRHFLTCRINRLSPAWATDNISAAVEAVSHWNIDV